MLVSFAMEAYDSVWLMADAMRRAGTFTDPDAIVQRAWSTTDISIDARVTTILITAAKIRYIARRYAIIYVASVVRRRW